MNKLLKFDTHEECKNIPTDAIIVTGKMIQNGKFNGLYAVFNSPFIYNTSYITQNTFDTQTGPCFNRRMFMLRKLMTGKLFFSHNKVVCPVK